jgi:hypothetical protein
MAGGHHGGWGSVRVDSVPAWLLRAIPAALRAVREEEDVEERRKKERKREKEK